MTFAFGELRLDPDRLELRHRGALVALEPQAFDVLVYLVRNRDRVVAKEELMDNVWGGRFVSETAVTSRIKQVRRALGDDGQTQTLVRTYHGRGYRFVADLDEAAAPGEPQHGHAAHAPHTGADAPVLTWQGEAEVRFQLTGQGPPDLVLLPPVPALDAEWEDPERAALLTSLGRLGRVIRLQASSDGPSGGTRGLLDVLDGAASDRAVLVAEGMPAGPVARFVQQHPTRVSALVLFGASAGQPSGALPGQTAAVLSGVAVPTLVLHRTGDQVVGVAQGRLLAASIPGAEFHALVGERHDAAADADQVVEAVRDLVEDTAAAEAAGRSLTALVGLAGDDLEALTAVLVGLGGRERRGPEGAVIVSFDGPAGAFRALGSRRARGLVDEVGVGVAIDDVSRDSWLVSGHGVDVARLFAGLAGPGEVLLPNVIRDLLAGSGLRSEPLPPVELPHVGHHPVHRWHRP